MRRVVFRVGQWLRSLPVLLGVLLISSVQLFGGAVPDAIGYFSDGKTLQGLITTAGIVGVILLALLSFSNREPSARMLEPRSVRTQADTRRGLIILTSRFEPGEKRIKDQIPPNSDRQARQEAINGLLGQAIQNNDTQSLALNNSNLFQAIRAVRAHAEPTPGAQGNLAYVWLLSTAGSTQSAQVLALELEQQFPQLKGRIFHASLADHGYLEIPGQDSDNKELIGRTKEAVTQIFASAEKEQLKPNQLVADVTGGFKTMTIGLTLACLARDRDIQYVSGVPEDPPTIYTFETRTASDRR